VVSGGHDQGRLHAARMQAARGLTLDRALGQVVDAFAAGGIGPLLIKGPAFARWLYADEHERPYRDIDLLVAPERFEAARRCLVELGFEQPLAGSHLYESSEHHEVWVRSGRPAVVVELHHTLFLLPAPPALVWRHLSEGARPIEVAGTRVDTPGVAASALIVGLHAAHHGSGFGKPIQDLERALERVDFETWRAAAALAHELGAAAELAVGLCLAPGGVDLVERLGLSPRAASRSVRLKAGTPPDTALGIERLLTTRGVRARLVLLAHELVPSRAFMRVCYPLARRGRLGLICAYAQRPWRLAVLLPRGARAWLIAARAPAESSPPRGS